MNLLKNRLPSTVEVGGFTFKVATDYGTALAILDCMKDDLFPYEDRVDMALDMFYVGDAWPVSRDLCLALMYDFLSCGDHDEHKSGRKVMDFDRDGNEIYTAIWRTYGVDLQETPVHWWKFNAMIQDLGEKTLLQNLLNIRTNKIQDVAEEKRAEFAKLQKELAVDGPRIDPDETLEERHRRW